mgnify:CR=1 FL=1
MAKLKEIPLVQIVDIHRGTAIPPESIKSRTTTERTGIQYLSVSNIQENYVNENLPYFTKIEDREYKYCLKENDIVLAKMGFPKFAIVKNLQDRKVIASQNLYILRCNENISPLYLKAFLESEEGAKRLDSAYVKSSIYTLPVKNLEKILIPILENSEENKIFQKSFSKEYSKLEKKEEKIRTSLENAKNERIGLLKTLLSFQ